MKAAGESASYATVHGALPADKEHKIFELSGSIQHGLAGLLISRKSLKMAACARAGEMRRPRALAGLDGTLRDNVFKPWEFSAILGFKGWNPAAPHPRSFDVSYRPDL
jgi:hypothetical protein